MINITEPITQKFSFFGSDVAIRRLDLIHAEVNGNKWYKLKYNLERAIVEEHKTILTFGGAWSNHIHATSSAARLMGLKSIGIIRGEEPREWSPTLLHAKDCGMRLEFITRMAYAEKDTEDFKSWLHEQYGSFVLVPEGGSNFLGVNGCMEILTEHDKEDYDLICCSCGTGATAAGLLLGASDGQKVLAFSALKDGGFLENEILRHIRYFLMDDEVAEEFRSRVQVVTPYSFGGYGKWNDELIAFIDRFFIEHEVPLDQVYTGKMMYGLLDMLRSGIIEKGQKILVIHSGGLQGRQSLER